MRIKSSFFIFLAFLVKVSYSQTYFNLFYSNIPKTKYDKFSNAFLMASGWVQTGYYTSPSDCSGCFDYTRDSKLQKTHLDELVTAYKNKKLRSIYSKQYVASVHHLVTVGKEEIPYIIMTLYRVENQKPSAVFQLKMTFYERAGKIPGIATIEMADSDKLKTIDPKTVLAGYRQTIKDDTKEPPPVIKQ